MRLLSWNVNGLRAVAARGDHSWLFQPESNLDVIGLQETKLQEPQLDTALRDPPGYRGFFSFGVRKGYSGTALYVRDTIACEQVPFLIGGATRPELDVEGRIVAVDFGAALVLCGYFPNGGSSDERLAFKHAWHDALLVRVLEHARQQPVILCGDFNIAHKPIDVALPERWAQHSGFLPVERAWFDRLLASGFVDSFRAEKGDLPRQFTFWDTRTDARPDNIGWRIDYVVVPLTLEERLLDAWIAPHVMGSDHCPVGVELDLRLQKRDAAASADGRGEEDAEEHDGDVEEEEDASARRRR